MPWLRSALADDEENRSEAREELRESELAMSRSMRELHVLAQQRDALRAHLGTDHEVGFGRAIAFQQSHAEAPLELGPAAAIDPDADRVVRKLTRAGYKAYLVGGCVRDLLLGHTPKDFDVATSAQPDDVQRLFRNEAVTAQEMDRTTAESEEARQHLYDRFAALVTVASSTCPDCPRPPPSGP